MKVKEYWKKKLLSDIESNLSKEEMNVYSLVYAGYLALGYEPIHKDSSYHTDEPGSDVVDLVKDMKESIVSFDANYCLVSPWEIFVTAEYIKEWAEYLGNTVIFEKYSMDDPFDCKERNNGIQNFSVTAQSITPPRNINSQKSIDAETITEVIAPKLKERYPTANASDLIKYADELMKYVNLYRANDGFIADCLEKAGILRGKRGQSANPLHAKAAINKQK